MKSQPNVTYMTSSEWKEKRLYVQIVSKGKKKSKRVNSVVYWIKGQGLEMVGAARKGIYRKWKGPEHPNQMP